MAVRLFTCFIGALLSSASIPGREDSGQKDAERYIVECERQWAESTATGDTSKVEQFLADDFRGVAPDGTFHDKPKEASDTHAEARNFAFSHLNEAKVRFYGDTAVVQGSESWEARSGKPRHGRFIWTDTWIKRKGKWQVVAAEDVSVSEDPAQ